jgi:LysW-gamma-L-alpha-aminoadipyl-6-phosphate/LysW-L-glutamyl-5-phosphate reductase
VQQVTSQSQAGRYVHGVHPNLRGATLLKFSPVERLRRVTCSFWRCRTAAAARQIDHFAGLAGRIIDLSADFRLRDTAAYREWYGRSHPHPDWLSRFVYGLPERYRDELRQAQLRQRRRLQRHGLPIWPSGRWPGPG